LPSLILRLEPLPEATAEHERQRAQSRQQALADQLAAERTAPGGRRDNGSSHHEAAPRSAAPSAAMPTPEELITRRIVDVAAPERLTVATPLTRWSAAVAAAHDACFVVDSNGTVISISVAAVELLGCGDAAIIGRHILDVLQLVDLESGAPDPEYAPGITALAVLDQPGLARSLLRVRHHDGSLVTLDSSSAPVHDVTGYPLGSVTFLAPIRTR
jgi:PAS domain S-box-containing protein